MKRKLQQTQFKGRICESYLGRSCRPVNTDGVSVAQSMQTGRFFIRVIYGPTGRPLARSAESDGYHGFTADLDCGYVQP